MAELRSTKCREVQSLRQTRSTLALLLLALGALAGCGPDNGRLEVGGKVLLDGAPLESGSIRFTSTGGETLVVSGSMIQEGVYHIPQAKGLLPGVYHLEIYSPDNNAPPVMARAQSGGPGIPVAPERIPAEYNVDSDKTIEVTPDGENNFVFEIQSKTTK